MLATTHDGNLFLSDTMLLHFTHDRNAARAKNTTPRLGRRSPSHWSGALASYLRGLPLALHLATAMMPLTAATAAVAAPASAIADDLARAPGVQVLHSRRAVVTPSAGA